MTTNKDDALSQLCRMGQEYDKEDARRRALDAWAYLIGEKEHPEYDGDPIDFCDKFGYTVYQALSATEPTSDFIWQGYEHAWKWIERALFCDHISEKEALEGVLKHSPYAPWNAKDQGIEWDTSHKEYDHKIKEVAATSDIDADALRGALHEYQLYYEAMDGGDDWVVEIANAAQAHLRDIENGGG